MKKVEQIQHENRKFFDRATRFYNFFPVEIVNRMIQRKVLKSVSIKSSSKVLDAGCGVGILLESLNDKNKHLELYGIDISKKMVDSAKKRLGKNSKIYLKSVENLGMKNRFDYIFSVDSFHHYANHEKVMENFYKALKKGGKLVVADFSFGKFMNKVFSNFEPGNSKMHLKKGFEALFSKHGFREIHQKRLGLFSILTIGKK